MSNRRTGITGVLATATLVVFAAIATAAPAAAATAAGPVALAATGADVMPWLIAAGVALLAGLAAVLVGVVRRRRS